MTCTPDSNKVNNILVTVVPKRISFTAPSCAMCSYRSNLFTNFNSTGGTEIGKGGPLLAAKISPGGLILEGGPVPDSLIFSLECRYHRVRMSRLRVFFTIYGKFRI